MASNKPVQNMAHPAATKSPSSDGLGSVLLRFNFYRDGLQASLTVNAILSLVIVILLYLVFHFANRPSEQRYFTVDAQGRIVKQQAMDAPYLTESALLDFAVRATTEAYTFDAENYRKALSDVGQYFTPEGHQSFLASMQPQIKYVVDKTLISSSVPSGTPVVSDRGVTPNGLYLWKVKVPVVVTFRTQTESSTVHRLVTIIIVNRPTFETPYGVGISSFIAVDQS